MSVPNSRTRRAPILVTGASGFIGRWLVDHLRAEGARPVVRFLRRASLADADSALDIHGDLQNSDDLDRLVAAGDTLIHLACTSNPRSADRDVVADLEQNLVTSARLFERFARAQPDGQVIFASTGGDMYGTTPSERPYGEETPPAPQSSYGIHKLAAEHYLRRTCERFGIAGVVFRIGNPYGVLLHQKRAHGLIGIALDAVLHETELTVIDPPDSVRDYLHLDDLSRAFTAGLAQPGSSGAFEIFNIGSGVGHSILDILDTIEQVTGRSVRRVDRVPQGRARSWNVLDTSRFHRHTGWRPRIGLVEGIARMWAEAVRPGPS